MIFCWKNDDIVLKNDDCRLQTSIRHRVQNTTWAEIAMDVDGALKVLTSLHGHDVHAGGTTLLLEEEAKGGQNLAETNKLRDLLDRRMLEEEALELLKPQKTSAQQRHGVQRTVSKRALKLDSVKELHAATTIDVEGQLEGPTKAAAAKTLTEVETLTLELLEVKELRTILARRAWMMDDVAGAVFPKTNVEATWGCGESELPSAITELSQEAKRRSVKLELRHEFRDMSDKQLTIRGVGAGLRDYRISHALKGLTPRDSVMVMIMSAEKLHADSREASALDSLDSVNTEAENVEAKQYVDRLSASRSLLEDTQRGLGVDPVQALEAERDAAAEGAKAVRDMNAEVGKVRAALKAQGKEPHKLNVQRIIDSDDSGKPRASVATPFVVDSEHEIAQIEAWITEAKLTATHPRTALKKTDRSQERYTIRIWGFGVDSWDKNPKSVGRYESGAVYAPI